MEGGRIQRRIAGRMGRILLAFLAWSVIAFLLLPVLTVIPMSFNDAAIFEVLRPNPRSSSTGACLPAGSGWTCCGGRCRSR